MHFSHLALANDARHRHAREWGVVLLTGVPGDTDRARLPRVIALRESTGARAALASQQVTQERLGEWLVKRGLASDQQVTAALAAQWQCPAVHDSSRPTSTYGAIPMSLLRACRMAPINGDNRSTLHLVFDGVVDHAALYAVQRMLDCPTTACIGSARMLDELLGLLATRSREWEVNFGENSPENVARIAANYADELSSGELRYVSFNGRFWMRIPRESDAVHLVFSGKA